jgi:hypothetical protein
MPTGSEEASSDKAETCSTGIEGYVLFIKMGMG